MLKHKNSQHSVLQHTALWDTIHKQKIENVTGQLNICVFSYVATV